MNIRNSFPTLILFSAIQFNSFTGKLIAQPSVKIGTQIWMKQNLNVDKFRNGENIPQAKTNEAWNNAGINKQPAWCYYNNDPANGAKYGKLYNWYAVIDPRGLAPQGWHIISEVERETFFALFGGVSAGTKLKEAGTKNWKTPNIGATNETGFTGLPGGFRGLNGFFNLGELGIWWGTDTPKSKNFVYLFCFTLFNVSTRIEMMPRDRGDGCSVRCLKD